MAGSNDFEFFLVAQSAKPGEDALTLIDDAEISKSGLLENGTRDILVDIDVEKGDEPKDTSIDPR